MDKEKQYEAKVKNLFDVVWLIVLMVSWVAFLVWGWKGLRRFKNWLFRTRRSGGGSIRHGNPPVVDVRSELKSSAHVADNSPETTGEFSCDVISGLAVEAGEAAERKVAEYLEKLSDKYSVFNSVWIKPNGWRQIDHVVVSENVVFVIETKCYSSLFSMWQSPSGKWIRFRDGSRVDEQMNPFRQVIGYANMIGDDLRRQNIYPVTIQPVVVSVNKWELSNIKSNVPLLKCNEICSYIVNFYTPYKLTKDNRLRMLDFFKAGTGISSQPMEQEETEQEETTDAA